MHKQPYPARFSHGPARSSHSQSWWPNNYGHSYVPVMVTHVQPWQPYQPCPALCLINLFIQINQIKVSIHQAAVPVSHPHWPVWFISQAIQIDQTKHAKKSPKNSYQLNQTSVSYHIQPPNPTNQAILSQMILQNVSEANKTRVQPVRPCWLKQLL